MVLLLRHDFKHPDPTRLSWRKKAALELWRFHRAIETKQHELRYLFWECTLRCIFYCKHCGNDCLHALQWAATRLELTFDAKTTLTPRSLPQLPLIRHTTFFFRAGINARIASTGSIATEMGFTYVMKNQGNWHIAIYNNWRLGSKNSRTYFRSSTISARS